METPEKLPHHEQAEYCINRPLYRQGRKLTAVKVYTIVSESTHLIISGVPDLNLQNELRACAAKYGDIVAMEPVSGFTDEAFVTAFHVKYARIQSARFAKKFLDASSFFGGMLHVCYAPERESVAEVRAKLRQRQREVEMRLRRNKLDTKTETPPTKFNEYRYSGETSWHGESVTSTTMNKTIGPTQSNLPSTSSAACYGNTHSFYKAQNSSSSHQIPSSTKPGTKRKRNKPPTSLQISRNALVSNTCAVKGDKLNTQSTKSAVLSVREKIRKIALPKLNTIVFRDKP